MHRADHGLCCRIARVRGRSPADIDSQRMMIRVEQGKGGKNHHVENSGPGKVDRGELDSQPWN